MDKEKIEKEGLLELYLLGELDPETESQVDELLSSNQELREQFREMELDFERIGRDNAINPPEKIEHSLREKLQGSYQIGQRMKRRSASLLVAASLAGIFALSTIWLYIQWKGAQADLVAMQEQTSEVELRLSTLEARYSETDSRYREINNPAVTPLLLTGNSLSPESRAIVYVNHPDRIVIVNASGLKPLERHQTYQMWADVEGEMINMGLVPEDQDYIPVRYIDKAESLNITIEPAGGNDHPTVENLISNIYL